MNVKAKEMDGNILQLFQSFVNLAKTLFLPIPVCDS